MGSWMLNKNLVAMLGACALAVFGTVGSFVLLGYLEKRKAETWLNDKCDIIENPEISENMPEYTVNRRENPEISENMPENPFVSEAEVDVNPSDIYQITEKEFLSHNGNSKLTAAYYVELDKLVGYDDEVNELDPEEEFGLSNLQWIFTKRQKTSLFIRDSKMEIDFEVVPIYDDSDLDGSIASTISASAGYISSD